MGGRGAVARSSSRSAPPVSPGDVWESWQEVRKAGPLTMCITNIVSVDLAANVLLAAGASPAMAYAVPEVRDFVTISAALYINMVREEHDGLCPDCRPLRNPAPHPSGLDRAGVGGGHEDRRR